MTTDTLFQLAGKKVLITGGSGGLGAGIATGLAQYGADIAIIARDKQQLKKISRQIQACTDTTVWTFSFDLQNTEDIDGLFKKIVAQTGGIDILVNCAGINLRAPAEQMPLQMWNDVIQTNLTAAFAVSQAFCRHRKKLGGKGKIINIGSLMCAAARPTISSYTASKGGLLALTRALAVEWAKYNINVNAIGPGYFETEMTKPLQLQKDFNQWVLSKTPLARWGKPQDLIGTAVFLASNASDFITGQIIYVDGGWLAAL